MLYYLHEKSRMSMAPDRAFSEGLRAKLDNPFNPMANTPMGRVVSSAADIFEHLTRSYGKPAWGLEATTIDGETVDVEEDIIIKRTYCHLLHFKRATDRVDPKLLIVAPLSGHYATLLRGTVEAMLPDHDVYITDFSSREKAGQDLDVAAPGSWVRGPFAGFPGYNHLPWWSKGIGDVVGNNPGNFFYVGGTSMAAPHVTATAALLLEKNDGLTQSQIAQQVGISQMHVSRLIRRSLEKIRDEIAVEEDEDAAKRAATNS